MRMIMSELNLEEKLEVAMDSFNGAMNSVLIILEEKQKLKEEKQELLEAAKEILEVETSLGGEIAICKLEKVIQKYEGG